MHGMKQVSCFLIISKRNFVIFGSCQRPHVHSNESININVETKLNHVDKAQSLNPEDFKQEIGSKFNLLLCMQIRI